MAGQTTTTDAAAIKAMYEPEIQDGIIRENSMTNGTLFPHLPTITKASEAASDHAAIWAELNLL